MKISTKKESSLQISKLNLNRLPQIVFSKYDKQKIDEFVRKYPAKFYAVRDMGKSNSKIFNLKVKLEDLHSYTKHLSNFLINVSSFNYTDNQLCTGEFLINPDMSLSLTISTNKTFSARDAVNNPDYNLITDIYDARLQHIKGINHIIDYIFNKNLFGIIVEFSAFDTTLGTNDENVVIYELRTHY